MAEHRDHEGLAQYFEQLWDDYRKGPPLVSISRKKPFGDERKDTADVRLINGDSKLSNARLETLSPITVDVPNGTQ